ncbi:FadR/GntR family transcriptional regulator [uncultured Caulobacter sp.]|uniref:FadR/GntR family transcriptional regulator n=1 Tax=uncultured Caulobacter sp. TaxID=158749 RepID=UPI0026253046|nr:FadR/GntR family transcriptional regulator [uncultured Caulobacter sp.]
MISSRKLYSDVAREISEQIQTKAYSAGEKLPSERELAETFGVSRPTVREAIIALEVLGLVKTVTRSGVYVADAPPAQVRTTDLDIGPFELLEARILFEGEVAALAARNITDEEIESLSAILDQLGVLNGRNDHSPALDRAFHVGIANCSRNASMVDAIETLWTMGEQSALCRHMHERKRNADWRPQEREHGGILAALAARDPAQARKAMRDHLSRVISEIMDATETELITKAREEISEKFRGIADRHPSISRKKTKISKTVSLAP